MTKGLQERKNSEWEDGGKISTGSKKKINNSY